MNWIKPDWPLPPHVHAAVSLRTGGVSTDGYASLNVASHAGDDAALVQVNRQRLSQLLNLPAEPVWLAQVHGTRVVDADTVTELTAADASISRCANTVCAVLTADCLPLLFCGDDGAVVGAAHGGWRGLQAGIIAETLAAMACQQVSVWLGPAIGPAAFEVGEEVRQAFVDQQSDTAAAFSAGIDGKWLADIYQIARLQLAALGVAAVYGGGWCTVTDSQRFYSYRRDGAATGRMATVIWRDAV